MQFIEPSYRILEIPDANNHDDVLRFLERIGRVCYKSEDKITDDSAIKYLEMIRNRKHWAMLEHFIFVMEIPYDLYHMVIAEILSSMDDPYFQEKIKYINISKYEIDNTTKYIVSGSMTAFNYIHECDRFHNKELHAKFYFDEIDNYNAFSGFETIFSFLKCKYPEIASTMPIEDYVWRYVSYSGKDIRFLTRDEIEALPKDLRLIHDSMTVIYTVNRGVTHELVRHRPCSWAQESTRYCNYGKKGMTFIIPCWITGDDREFLLNADKLNELYKNYVDEFVDKSYIDDYNLSSETIMYLSSIFESTLVYENLLKEGWVAQQSRDVLQNAIKADIVQTAKLGEWKHFFDMRADKPAHPQMREVVIPLLIESAKSHSGIFDEQLLEYTEYRYEEK